jgi:hypothetical protein
MPGSSHSSNLARPASNAFRWRTTIYGWLLDSLGEAEQLPLALAREQEEH